MKLRAAEHHPIATVVAAVAREIRTKLSFLDPYSCAVFAGGEASCSLARVTTATTSDGGHDLRLHTEPLDHSVSFSKPHFDPLTPPNRQPEMRNCSPRPPGQQCSVPTGNA